MHPGRVEDWRRVAVDVVYLLLPVSFGSASLTKPCTGFQPRHIARSVRISRTKRAHMERLIGSIRRECLDYWVVFSERSLKRHLPAYCAYYHRTRTHLALRKDCPESRRIEPPDAGLLVSNSEGSGLTIGMNAELPEESREIEETSIVADEFASPEMSSRVQRILERRVEQNG